MQVMIWDDHQSRCIGELSFRSDVKAVRLRRDRVVVVLTQRIYVYRFSDLHLLDRINTIRNDQGLVALCADASNMVLACPGVSRGHVNVELYDLRRSTLIPAHESELAQVRFRFVYASFFVGCCGIKRGFVSGWEGFGTGGRAASSKSVGVSGCRLWACYYGAV